MKEHLISFETAKLAHEKGFTRTAIGISFTSVRRNYYTEKGELNGDVTEFVRQIVKNGKDKVSYTLYPATSQSLLQQWLREKHKEHIRVTYIPDRGYFNSSLTMRSMGWFGYKDYRIEADSQAIVLITTEEYDKIDKDNRKPTGEKGEKEVKTWHPNIKQALQEYTNQIGRKDSTLEGIIERIENAEKSIEELKKLYHKKLIA